MHSPDILEEPTVRHYLPPSRPQVRVNFYQVSLNEVSIHSRTIEIVADSLERTHSDTLPQSKHLLSKPIAQIKAEIQSNEERKLFERPEPSEETENMEDINEALEESENDAALWVDKYAPRNFLELLTDDRVNREFLTWMKSWDKIVFPKKPKPQKSFFPNSTPSFLNKGLSQYYQMREKELTCDAHKVALIAGPPGVGKSVLARVVARHCGYEAIEMNASDDRTKTKLMEKVFDATQIQRLNVEGGSVKPHCLVLDEIDGAQDGEGRSAIKALYDFVLGKTGKKGRRKVKKVDENAEDKVKEDESEGEEEENIIKEVEDMGLEQKKKKKGSIIKRPIICICNDLYSKSLAPLRKIAIVFHVRGMDPNQMSVTIKEICSKEKVMVGIDLISALCKQSKYDMRSCLNSLQLAAGYHVKGKHKLITKDMLFYRDSNKLISSKDRFQGIFEVWDEVLSTNLEKGRKTINYIRQVISRDDSPGFILDGIYYNCLSNSTGNLDAIATFLDYLGLYNVQETAAYRTQHFELLSGSYLPAAFFARELANSEKPKIEFPSMFSDSKKAAKQNENIVEALIDKWTKYGYRVNVFRKDILTYIYEFIQPRIRELNTVLLKEEELKILSFAIKIMLSFGITLNRGFGRDDSNHAFFPHFEPLLWFKGLSNYIRITEKLMLIMGSEYEQMKLKMNFSENPYEIKKPEEKTGPVKRVAPMLMPGMKRNKEIMERTTHYPIIYKYKEGCISGIRRNLALDFFFK